MKALKERMIIMKGAGEMASGIACRLHRSGFRRLLMLETSFPLAVRREVSFCEAVHDGQKAVEGIEAVQIEDGAGLAQTWEQGMIAVMVDPKGDTVRRLQPDILIDAPLPSAIWHSHYRCSAGDRPRSRLYRRHRLPCGGGNQPGA